MRQLPKKHARHRTLLLGLGGLAAASFNFAGCQHSAAAQKLADDAEDLRKAIADGQEVATKKDPTHSEGELASVVLKPSEAPLDDDAPEREDGDRVSCGEDVPIRDAYLPDTEVQAEAKQLLARMSIDQKVIQLTGIEPPPHDGSRYPAGSWEDIQRSRDEPALNLRGYLWRDGPHGLNLESGPGRFELDNYATSFPTSVAQGATFDLDVVRRVGAAIGDETVASGNNVLLGPCMNVLRHPLWGRAQETFGEDTYHLGRIAVAFTEGLQEYVSGCAKHYTANNIEQHRFSINSKMDEQTLREVYGRHFEMVVRDGGVGCMMASYNHVNGTKSTQNKHTLTEMLRDDMGFKGMVITDWWAMPGANNGQGPVNSPQDRLTAAEALKAGLDVELPWTLNYDAIPNLVADGDLDVALVDKAVLRVLEQKLRFDTAYLDGPLAPKEATTGYDPSTGAVTELSEHAALAEEMAEKAMVLLKNSNDALPLKEVTTIAVIGATVDYNVVSDFPSNKKFNFVTDAALGDRGSSRVSANPEFVTGPLAGLQSEAPSGVNIISGSTAADAEGADAVIVVVGLTPGDEGEEYTGASDRENLSLGAIQDDLVRSITASTDVPVIVVIEAGGVVDLPWINEVDAVVMAWYPGQGGGAALGRLLFGERNFAGRLPVTWPTAMSQFPNFDEGNTTVMDYYVGYRLFDKKDMTPLFAFGHGLSYSTFDYEGMFIPCADVTENGVINVEVDVRNTSDVDGDEVIMAFASFPETKVRRSIKELKAFTRVNLKGGEAKRVTIPVRVQDLKYWDTPSSSWVVEKGPVLIQVGPSSDKLDLKQTVTVH